MYRQYLLALIVLVSTQAFGGETTLRTEGKAEVATVVDVDRQSEEITEYFGANIWLDKDASLAVLKMLKSKIKKPVDAGDEFIYQGSGIRCTESKSDSKVVSCVFSISPDGQSNSDPIGEPRGGGSVHN